MNKNKFIEAIAPIIKKVAPEFNICVVSPIIAQACLESAYGSSNKAKYHNYFGLKYRSNRVHCHNGYFKDDSREQLADGSYVPTTDDWYSFDNMESGVRGYFEFISISRYSNLKGVSSPKKYLELIRADGYATSLNYVESVYNTVKSNNLERFDKIGDEVTMKYGDSNKPLVCMQTNSTCYKGTRKMPIKGVLFHSTGANNPNLKRYVQPSIGVSDYDKMIKLLGKNTYNNDWNHIYREAGLNAWIGRLADGTVTTVQTMPWDYRPWGCGSGRYGSCNDGWIQFEICEDGLVDRDYFNKVYNEAIELTAYLCKLYGLNPHGNANINGVSVPVITCHADSHELGLGCNHGDVNHWFPKHGKSMKTARDDIARLLSNNVEPPKHEVEDTPNHEVGEMYRVRKSWSDAKSQLGAYRALDNAKKACKEGYSVFDSKGSVVYSNANGVVSKPRKTVEQLAQEVLSFKFVYSNTNGVVNNHRKTVEQLAQEVLNGKWGNGNERKKRLSEAGYDYNLVQDKVNKIANNNSKPVKSVEELAKEVWYGKWGNGKERKNRLTNAGYNYNAVQAMVNKLYG